MDYQFNCKTHGDVIISVSMKDVKEKMPCPECGEECQRIYSPILDIWRTNGAYGHKSN